MINEDRIAQILMNGTESELQELKIWLFKEAVRLENMESSLDTKRAHLESEKNRLQGEIERIRLQMEADKEKLNADNAFFEQKLQILREGYDKLNHDKSRLEKDREYFDRERRYYKESVYDEVSVFFRGVNSLLALKKRYKELIKIFHPDNLNGDQEVIQMINKEYSALLTRYDLSMKA